MLKVVEFLMEFICFEGEIDIKGLIIKFILKLEGKFIKLSGFVEFFKVWVVEFKVKFFFVNDWNFFFREVGNLDEWNLGERLDIIVIKGLLCKWFVDDDLKSKLSEDVLVFVFCCFGKIWCVDILILDFYR